MKNVIPKHLESITAKNLLEIGCEVEEADDCIHVVASSLCGIHNRHSSRRGSSNGGQMEKRLFTSESVTEGHPDKICDAVSDAVLDALMEQDPFSRVACETCTNTGFVLEFFYTFNGEITTKAKLIDIPAIVRKTVTEPGYDSSGKGFDGNTCAVMVSLDKITSLRLISLWA